MLKVKGLVKTPALYFVNNIENREEIIVYYEPKGYIIFGGITYG